MLGHDVLSICFNTHMALVTLEERLKHAYRLTNELIIYKILGLKGCFRGNMLGSSKNFSL